MKKVRKKTAAWNEPCRCKGFKRSDHGKCQAVYAGTKNQVITGKDKSSAIHSKANAKKRDDDADTEIQEI